MLCPDGWQFQLLALLVLLLPTGLRPIRKAEGASFMATILTGIRFSFHPMASAVVVITCPRDAAISETFYDEGKKVRQLV